MMFIVRRYDVRASTLIGAGFGTVQRGSEGDRCPAVTAK